MRVRQDVVTHILPTVTSSDLQRKGRNPARLHADDWALRHNKHFIRAPVPIKRHCRHTVRFPALFDRILATIDGLTGPHVRIYVQQFKTNYVDRYQICDRLVISCHIRTRGKSKLYDNKGACLWDEWFRYERNTLCFDLDVHGLVSLFFLCCCCMCRRIDETEILCGLIGETGLGDDLDGESWTLFAPTNDAFENLPEGYIDSLMNNTEGLTGLLLFHAVAGERLNVTQLVCDSLIEMANGQLSTTVCEQPERIYQAGAFNSPSELPEIIVADIEACNGMVHVIRYAQLSSNSWCHTTRCMVWRLP